jgi:hypothetical protein
LSCNSRLDFHEPGSTWIPPAPIQSAPTQPTSFAERFPGQIACAAHPEFPVGGACSHCRKPLCFRCAPALSLRDDVRCATCTGLRGPLAIAETGAGPYDSIGGWLMLLGLGVITAPLIGVYLAAVVFMTAWPALRSGEGITTPVLALIGRAILLLGIAIFDGFAAAQFLERRKSATVLLILSRSLHLTGLLSAWVIWRGLFHSTTIPNARSTISEATMGVVWMAYLFTSERVRRTFVR